MGSAGATKLASSAYMVRDFPCYLGHILWDEEDLSLGDKFLQYYNMRLLGIRSPFINARDYPCTEMDVFMALPTMASYKAASTVRVERVQRQIPRFSGPIRVLTNDAQGGPRVKYGTVICPVI